MLMEFAGGPPGMPPFASYILQRIWEVSLAADVSGFTFFRVLSNIVTVIINTSFFLLEESKMDLVSHSLKEEKMH